MGEDNKTADIVRHLAELRKRILIAAVFFIVFMAIGLYLAPRTLDWIKENSFPKGVDWNVFSFTDGLFIYMKCAFLFAVLFTLPIVLQQVWRFVEPGLTEKEARGSKVFIPASFVLFLTGILFAYFFVFPMMIGFMSEMNRDIGANEVYGISAFFTFLFNIVFPIAVAFEMPVVVLFLTKLGILSHAKLGKVRKYAYLLLVIIGSMISPPDFVSHLSVSVPLILLFEASVVCSRVYGARRSRIGEVKHDG